MDAKPITEENSLLDQVMTKRSGYVSVERQSFGHDALASQMDSLNEPSALNLDTPNSFGPLRTSVLEQYQNQHLSTTNDPFDRSQNFPQTRQDDDIIIEGREVQKGVKNTSNPIRQGITTQQAGRATMTRNNYFSSMRRSSHDELYDTSHRMRPVQTPINTTIPDIHKNNTDHDDIFESINSTSKTSALNPRSSIFTSQQQNAGAKPVLQKYAQIGVRVNSVMETTPKILDASISSA